MSTRADPAAPAVGQRYYGRRWRSGHSGWTVRVHKVSGQHVEFWREDAKTSRRYALPITAFQRLYR